MKSPQTLLLTSLLPFTLANSQPEPAMQIPTHDTLPSITMNQVAFELAHLPLPTTAPDSLLALRQLQKRAVLTQVCGFWSGYTLSCTGASYCAYENTHRLANCCGIDSTSVFTNCGMYSVCYNANDKLSICGTADCNVGTGWCNQPGASVCKTYFEQVPYSTTSYPYLTFRCGSDVVATTTSVVSNTIISVTSVSGTPTTVVSTMAPTTVLSTIVSVITASVSASLASPTALSTSSSVSLIGGVSSVQDGNAVASSISSAANSASTSASSATVKSSSSTSVGSSGSTTSPVAENTTGHSTGAIAGGVVGGIVGLALLGALGWFIRSRIVQKRYEKEAEAPEMSGMSHDGQRPY